MLLLLLLYASDMIITDDYSHFIGIVKKHLSDIFFMSHLDLFVTSFVLRPLPRLMASTSPRRITFKETLSHAALTNQYTYGARC